jgi:hypothetical protein
MELIGNNIKVFKCGHYFLLGSIDKPGYIVSNILFSGRSIGSLLYRRCQEGILYDGKVNLIMEGITITKDNYLIFNGSCDVVFDLKTKEMFRCSKNEIQDLLYDNISDRKVIHLQNIDD